MAKNTVQKSTVTKSTVSKSTDSISSDLLAEALKATVDGIVISEIIGDGCRIIFVNPAFESLTGYTADEVIGNDYWLYIQGTEEQPEIETLRQTIANRESCRVTFRNHKKSGEPFWSELSISPVFSGNGQLTHYIAVQKDVTQRVEKEQSIQERHESLLSLKDELQELASRDALTGLHNRRYFAQELDRLWAVHQRLEATMAVIFIDIDSFKLYNDHYGHLEGDKALKAVAGVIAESFSRKADLVARFGGEEFVVVATLENGVDCLLQHLEQLRQSIIDLKIENQYSAVSPYLTISTGVCYGIPPKDSSSSLFTRDADIAMYQAKKTGRNRIEVVSYEPDEELVLKPAS
ncbi:MAG: diguanylate cyclase [Kangiella sp.]|nr:diguanylate cyclase [Kangiella sp.]